LLGQEQTKENKKEGYGWMNLVRLLAAADLGAVWIAALVSPTKFLVVDHYR
jgi:hypothetical protein